jgi:hypothetical protein
VHSFEDAYEGYAEALRMDAENTKMASKLLCKRAIAALKLKRCAPRQCNRLSTSASVLVIVTRVCAR